jgi:hypothetical protein
MYTLPEETTSMAAGLSNCSFPEPPDPQFVRYSHFIRTFIFIVFGIWP